MSEKSHKQKNLSIIFFLELSYKSMENVSTSTKPQFTKYTCRSIFLKSRILKASFSQFFNFVFFQVFYDTLMKRFLPFKEKKLIPSES